MSCDCAQAKKTKAKSKAGKKGKAAKPAKVQLARCLQKSPRPFTLLEMYHVGPQRPQGGQERLHVLLCRQAGRVVAGQVP